MAKFKVELDREACIGAAECEVVSPRFWKVLNDGKAHIVGTPEIEGAKSEQLVIDEKDLEANLTAARVCPVKVIRIKNIEKNEYIV